MLFCLKDLSNVLGDAIPSKFKIISLLNTLYENIYHPIARYHQHTYISNKHQSSNQNQPLSSAETKKKKTEKKRSCLYNYTMPPTKRCFREAHPRMRGELIAAGAEYKRVAASGVPTCVEREPSAVGKVWAGWGCRAFSGGEGSRGRVRALWRRLSARRGGIAVVAAVTIRSSVSDRVCDHHILSQDTFALVASRTRVRVFFARASTTHVIIARCFYIQHRIFIE